MDESDALSEYNKIPLGHNRDGLSLMRLELEPWPSQSHIVLYNCLFQTRGPYKNKE